MPATERRQHRRHPLATSVEFYHPPSHRNYPGRAVDISFGGMLMYVPATTPLQPGHTVRLALGSVNRPEYSRLSEQPLDASVVRVDRHELVRMGQIAVGLRFLAT